MKSGRNNKKDDSPFIRSLLHGPVPKNPLHSHQTLFIHQFSGLTAFSLIVSIIISLSRSNWTDALIFGSIAIISIGIFVLNYLYQNRFCGIIVLVTMLFGSTAGFFTGPDVTRLGALFTFVSFVFMSAMILRKRIFYIMFGFSFIILAVLLILAAQGKLGVRLGANLSELQVFAVLSIFVVIAIVSEGAANIIRENEEKL